MLQHASTYSSGSQVIQSEIHTPIHGEPTGRYPPVSSRLLITPHNSASGHTLTGSLERPATARCSTMKKHRHSPLTGVSAGIIVGTFLLLLNLSLSALMPACSQLYASMQSVEMLQHHHCIISVPNRCQVSCCSCLRVEVPTGIQSLHQCRFRLNPPDLAGHRSSPAIPGTFIHPHIEPFTARELTRFKSVTHLLTQMFTAIRLLSRRSVCKQPPPTVQVRPHSITVLVQDALFKPRDCFHFFQSSPVWRVMHYPNLKIAVWLPYH